jgi:hypothetical protein
MRLLHTSTNRQVSSKHSSIQTPRCDMKNRLSVIVCLFCFVLISVMPTSELAAQRGRGGGGRGGGGMSRGGGGGGMSRGPSVSRPSASRTPSMSRPSSRPSMPSSRPSTRPSVPSNRPSTRPSTPSNRPSTQPSVPSNRPSTRPSLPSTRPSQGQLNDFLDLGRPSTGQRPSARPGGGVSNGAVSDFLNRPGGASPGQLPSRPNVGDRPNSGNRPNVGDRPNAGDRPGVGNRPNRPGEGIAGLPTNRPAKIVNREAHNNWRVNRGTHIRGNVGHLPYRSHFWSNHHGWSHWGIGRPYRWATWGAVATWFPWGWSQPAYYNYGGNVYYEGDNVYYGDQVVATTTEYAEQAQGILSSAPEVSDDTEWMSLGVFALTQDNESSDDEPTLYMQLVVNKEGVIAGTVMNTATEETQEIEGMVDKDSQRAAFVVSGKTSPIMETGIVNLTKDEAPALLHFSDGQSQQWLMVRLEEPEEEKNKG